MNKIYSLNWDYNHSGDMERDAFHIPFENSDKASIIFLNPKYKDKLPNKMLFRANFNIIPDIDFPLTDLNVPIFSEKMIFALKDSGDFEAIFTDVIMIDDTYLYDIFNKKGDLKTEIITNSSYKAVTLLNREDAFDYKNSIYQPSELNPNKPGFINKLVLKQSSELPPVFRIKESPSKIFITENAKDSIEEKGIKGCVFEEVETTPTVV